jgi:hypothetical protein
MAARMLAEACEILGIRSEVRNSGIYRSTCALHQPGEALTPTRFARSFEHEPQSLLDQVPEFAAPQRRLRLGPAVKIVRDFDCGLPRTLNWYKTIYPYLWIAPPLKKAG